MPNAKATTIQQFLLDKVEPGSTTVSDGDRA